MATMKLGSKSEALQRQGQTWTCTTGLSSDVVIEIGEMSFHLHKLHDIPGGAKAFELVTKFCYGIRLDLTASNVVSLRCAAEHLRMTEDYGEGNLILHAETFLNEVFASWTDTLKALDTCEEVLPHAEDLHIVSRCINSLAMKACADPFLFGWPMSAHHHPALWNGIGPGPSQPKPVTSDWWHEDVALLSLPLYKRLIVAVEDRGLKPECVAGSIMLYARRYLPGLTRGGNSVSALSENDQRGLLEEVVNMLPAKKGVTPTNFLLGLLRTAMLLHASPSCKENLERRSHPWLTDSEREQLCRLMNCQKLSLEACTHAAQNERLPLRVVVQVLFFEQLRLRTSIAGWFFVSDNLENTQHHHPTHPSNLMQTKNDGQAEITHDSREDHPVIGIDDMKVRVSELEKECLNMKQEIEKLGKPRSSWNIFSRKLGLGSKTQSSSCKGGATDRHSDVAY
ncbi:BTB/POZ domain-containing protein [Acorus gramineus]|uniref:BTB/POZ domain-containing protein n=1 Tax=Acorus gramineus TaxID=55184 RepID=A0AAV9ATR8_ACOGR|nr:BTB/POZ domain-containing protein [Acorus gramineus]